MSVNVEIKGLEQFLSGIKNEALRHTVKGLVLETVRKIGSFKPVTPPVVKEMSCGNFAYIPLQVDLWEVAEPKVEKAVAKPKAEKVKNGWKIVDKDDLEWEQVESLEQICKSQGIKISRIKHR